MDDSIIILDTNVMSPIILASPDNTCSLLDWIAEYHKVCMISQKQYQKSPCNNYECRCKSIEDEFDFSSEDVFAFFDKHASSMMKILKDLEDGVIVCFAFQTNALVVSCDGGVLQACRICNIDHICFKAFMVNLHDKCSIFDLHGDGFDFRFLFDQNGSHPFHSFFKNHRCKQCCGGECEALKKGQELKSTIS